jgi:hypothetical protein
MAARAQIPPAGPADHHRVPAGPEPETVVVACRRAVLDYNSESASFPDRGERPFHTGSSATAFARSGPDPPQDTPAEVRR